MKAHKEMKIGEQFKRNGRTFEVTKIMASNENRTTFEIKRMHPDYYEGLLLGINKK